MKILITGGAGFIGNHLFNKLTTMGHSVHVIDKNKNPSITKNFHKIDISKKDQLMNFETDIDLIIHAAAQSTGYYSQVDPENDCLSNSLGTINICNLARRLKVKKIIYLSTMAVYGNGESLKESSDLNPLSNYGVTKLSGEFYVKTMPQYGIKYSIFRLWNTFGPGQNMENPRNGIVSVYLSQALKSNVVEVTGSLDRFRDLVYIDDCVSAIILGLSHETDFQIYNVCNSKKIHVKDMILEIQKYFLDKDLKIKVLNGHDGDQSGSTGDNKKLLNLGWLPKFNFKKGIEKFVKHEKSSK